jgi:class 3 adenylate cyclase
MTASTLPVGTVTFLFTDIEGSTRIVQSVGDAWIGILEAHDELVRRAIESHRGVVVQTEGDAFFAVFPRAVDAVVAAAEAQRALAAYEWPRGAAVTVRMGVHTGLGTLGGDSYVGLDVHRASRITAAAHGGQVVVSEPTAVLAERDLAAGLTLLDLGKHRLKDLAQPETLFQLVIPGLGSTFPPLATLDAVPNNLPMQITSFVGRGDDIARALDLFADSRVLTITGAGGTGKTRLALQIGAELAGGFRDGVFFVDLAPVHDADVVASQVLRSVGLQSSAGARPPEEALLEQIGAREVLLILDNFEQVIDAAPLVGEMVRRSPRSKFIVTSRGPLRIAAEQEMPLEPLGLPAFADPATLTDFDAVALFVDRATAVRPDFSITADNAAAVAELVRRLDGLPLAIELVATRVRLLPVATILERLDPGSLGSGAVDLPARQRTIHGAIAWSHELLGEPVRRLFARLGVFAGGAELTEIEMVCGESDGVDVLDGVGVLDSVGVLDGLGVLLDQSLIRRADQGDRPGSGCST